MPSLSYFRFSSRLLLLLAVWLVLPGAVLGAEQRLKFAWFSSLYPEHSFWQQNWAFSKAAADDFQIELIPFYLNSDQIRYQTSLRAIHKDASFDGIVFINMKSQNQALIDLINQGEALAVSHTVTMDYAETGQPGADTGNWVAEVLVDEEKTGYNLAKRLIADAQARRLLDAQGRIQVFAIIGSKTDSVGLTRERGFLRAIAEFDNVLLHQIFYARHWSKQESYRFTASALKRYPETRVVLSGNDDIALGVIEAARDHGRTPGVDLLTGGIDGTVALMEKVRDGEAVCTIGGLFLHGAWSVVLLFDYIHGVDIDEESGRVVRVDNTLIDAGNVDAYLHALTNRDWGKIDFRAFSKAARPDNNNYAFSFSRIVEQLTESD